MTHKNVPTVCDLIYDGWLQIGQVANKENRQDSKMIYFHSWSGDLLHKQELSRDEWMRMSFTYLTITGLGLGSS